MTHITHLTSHTSHQPSLTSHVLHDTSRISHHSHYITSLTSHIPHISPHHSHHTSLTSLTSLTSHITHITQHSHHTSHITHHSSFTTPLTSHFSWQAQHLVMSERHICAHMVMSERVTLCGQGNIWRDSRSAKRAIFWYKTFPKRQRQPRQTGGCEMTSSCSDHGRIMLGSCWNRKWCFMWLVFEMYWTCHVLQLPSVLHPVGCAAQCAGRFMCRGVRLCRTQLYFVVRTHTLEYKVILFSRE